MDYAGWAAAYGGKMTARILGMEEIDRALEAYGIYRTMCRYPAGYREALLRARRLPTPEGSCSVAVKKSH